MNSIPYKMKVTQGENDFAIQKTIILEYTDDMITNENLTLDGKECASEFWNSPRMTKATWSQKNDTLFVDSKVMSKRNGQNLEMVSHESWTLHDKGTILSLKTVSSSPWGERTINMIFDAK